MRTGLLVGDAMTKRPITVPPNLTIKECSKLLIDKDIGSVLVLEGNALLGILTEYDLVKAIAQGKEPQKTMVKEIMTVDLLTVAPKKDIYDALTTMKDHDVRHLPVMENDLLIGFLTLKDVLKIQPQLFELLTDRIGLREEERKLRARDDMEMPWE